MINFRVEILKGTKFGVLSTIYVNQMEAIVEEIQSISFQNGRVFATGRARVVDKVLH